MQSRLGRATRELKRFVWLIGTIGSLAPFIGLSPAISTRVLGRVLNIVGGRQKPRALGQVERLRQTIAETGLAKATTVLGCVIRIKDGAIAVARGSTSSSMSDL